MNFIFRVAIAILAIACVVGTAACATTGRTGFRPGTYQGTAGGHNGPVTVEVIVDAERILSVRVVSHIESEGFAEQPIARIPPAIVAGQNLDVNVVSGATATSRAIILAASRALEQSGANMRDLQASR
jgi:fumarate reductase flavoprotein subunit